MLYLWLKAFHVIAVIAWMAGMLYLPRLFVYHCDTPKGSAQSETFKVMERRLLKAIMNPAMIAAWVLGLALVWQGGWIHGRLAARQAPAGADPLRDAWLSGPARGAVRGGRRWDGRRGI